MIKLITGNVGCGMTHSGVRKIMSKDSNTEKVTKEEFEYNKSIDRLCSRCNKYADVVIPDKVKLCKKCYDLIQMKDSNTELTPLEKGMNMLNKYPISYIEKKKAFDIALCEQKEQIRHIFDNRLVILRGELIKFNDNETYHAILKRISEVRLLLKEFNEMKP